MNKALIIALLSLAASCNSTPSKEATTQDGTTVETPVKQLPLLRISENKRYFVTANGDPFFWMGDTGWLLFSKTSREDADKYLEDRRQKGFNVVQVMVLHGLNDKDAYGDKALLNKNAATPDTTKGNDFKDSLQYDYWDHVDYIVDKAAEKGIYMAMVAVWGSVVKSGGVNTEQAKAYATFLANRYKDRTNIIWVDGGDVKGSDSTQVWKTIGATLKSEDGNHLVTYHPFGRTQSSFWFHNEPWLDFNMFQSGHRDYKQQANEPGAFSESNWKFVNDDYKKTPAKPTLDGEPSYEGIPHGLHDTSAPRWTAADVRRYGYWSVFAGAAGYTYGNNSVMQFLNPTDKGSAYGARAMWTDAINDPGAGQMGYLKKLMLSHAYLERVPDQSLIAGQGDKYNYLAATRGKNYAYVYTYTGRTMNIVLGKIEGATIKASWFNPQTGGFTQAGSFDNKGTKEFDPPGEPKDGNDWVLVLETEDGKN